jgi:hypothetical protein
VMGDIDSHAKADLAGLCGKCQRIHNISPGCGGAAQ